MRNESVMQFTLDFCRKAGRNADTFHFTPLLERAAGFLFSNTNQSPAIMLGCRVGGYRKRVENYGRLSIDPDRLKEAGTTPLPAEAQWRRDKAVRLRWEQVSQETEAVARPQAGNNTDSSVCTVGNTATLNGPSPRQGEECRFKPLSSITGSI